MFRPLPTAIAAALVALLAHGATHADDASTIPHVVTADIAEGIERHIEEQVREGGGRFALEFEDRTLRLKLVRIHTEYLANLGPRRHFACVDLADIEGDVYDVDFFLEGEPGDMTVTETSVHKLNGQPFYAWRQNDRGVWERVAMDAASNDLLGVVEGEDRFEFLYRVDIPTLDAPGRMWIPLPATDDWQTVEIAEIDAPVEPRVLTDERYGNRVLYLELTPEHAGRTIEIRSEVTRREKTPYADDDMRLEQFLAPDRLIPVNDRFRDIASEVLEGKDGELVRARALYDHTIDHMRYIKAGTYGTGDAAYACDIGTGNCTEFHTYFIALARSAGIPARFAIGAAIPSERDAGAIDGYHCWAEFYADGKWWPVDISEADKYSALATYYFGRHPANRIELSRGRDITVEPGPESGPINFFAYPVLEVDGDPVRAPTTFAFWRLSDQ